MDLRCHRDTYQNHIGHTHDSVQCISDHCETEIALLRQVRIRKSSLENLVILHYHPRIG